MSEKPDLIERANLLIKAETGVQGKANPETPRLLRRRRSFIARDLGIDAEQIRARLAASRADDDDLPVLTEEIEDVAAGHADAAALSRDGARVLAELVEQRLVELLPDLLQAALANATRYLQQEIETGVAQSLREFVSQHALPLAPRHAPKTGEVKSGND